MLQSTYKPTHNKKKTGKRFVLKLNSRFNFIFILSEKRKTKDLRQRRQIVSVQFDLCENFHPLRHNEAFFCRMTCVA